MGQRLLYRAKIKGFDPSGPHATRGIVDYALITGPTTGVVGSTAQLTATAYDRNGNAIAGVGVVWFSSQPTFTSVSVAGGLLSFLVPGVATITALVDGRPYTVLATALAGSLFSLLTQDGLALLAQDGSELITQGL